MIDALDLDILEQPLAATGIASFIGLYIPKPSEIDPIALVALPQSARRAAEIAGRVQFAVGSLMVFIVATAGIVYSDLIAMAAGYWGLFFTTTLIAAAAPAMITLNRDIENFAAGLEPSGGEKSAWMGHTGIAIAPRQAVVAAIAAAAPVLSSPRLDLLSGLFG